MGDRVRTDEADLSIVILSLGGVRLPGSSSDLLSGGFGRHGAQSFIARAASTMARGAASATASSSAPSLGLSSIGTTALASVLISRSTTSASASAASLAVTSGGSWGASTIGSRHGMWRCDLEVVEGQEAGGCDVEVLMVSTQNM